MRYEFDKSYLLNKDDIEGGTNFDRKNFFFFLKKELGTEGFVIDRDYFLGSEDVNEGLCLHEDGQFWVVSYFERGIQFAPAFFVDPDDAALFLTAKLKRRYIGST